MAVTQIGYSLRNDLKLIADESEMIKTPLLAPILAPEALVPQISASQPTLPKGETLKMGDDTRANPNGGLNRGTFGTSSTTYYTERFGWEELIDRITMLENDEYFDSQMVASEICRMVIMMGREKRVADAYADYSSYGGNVVSATAAWTNASSADPLADIVSMSAKTKAAFGATKESLSFIVRDTIVDSIFKSDAFTDNAKYVENMETKTLAEMAEYLRKFLKVGEVIITSGLYNTSGINVTASFDDIWDDNYAMLVWRGSSAINRPGFAKQPIWSKFAKDYKIDSYVDEAIQQLIIRIQEYRGLKMDYTYGCILTGVNP